MDYSPRLYNFIFSQIKDLKYMYIRKFEAIKDMGIVHYGLDGYTDDSWVQAWNWATHDVFGDQT